VIIKKSGREEAVFREVGKFVNLDSVIGVRTDRLLVKRDEKHFDGITGTFLVGTGNIVEKFLFLFGSRSVKTLSYKRGAMEIYIS